MYYRLENGSIVGGPFNCEQGFPVTLYPDDHPDVIAWKQAVQASIDNPPPDRISQLEQQVADLQSALIAKGTIALTDIAVVATPVRLAP